MSLLPLALYSSPLLDTINDPWFISHRHPRSRQHINHPFYRDMTLFDDVFENSKQRLFDKKVIPVDIKESSNNYELSADIPGIPKDQIDISVKDRVLTITGERKHEESTEENGFKRVEVSKGVISRSFTLPKDADEDKIEAKYENGVLTLSINKLSNEMNIDRVKKIALN
jgi:HSP20 family protein